MTALFYVGRDKRGVAQGGQADADAAEFVERRFKSGWSFLVVVDNEKRDRRLGAIEAHPQIGKRTWWAESPVASNSP